jgi:hypothetical protein
MKRLALFLLFMSLALSGFTAEHQAVTILLDNSRSVPPEDFQKAKTLIDQLVQQAGGPVTVYVFGTEMKKIDSAELSSVKPTDSYTMVYDSAYDASQELTKIEAEHKSIVVISDGIDTKSATVLEDIVKFANEQGIAIYGIGVGKPNRKTLERMARLTGGKFFGIDSSNLAEQLQSSFADQKLVPKKEEAKTVIVQQPAPATSPEVSQPQSANPVQTEPEKQFSYKWILILALAGVVLFGVVFIIARAYRTQDRLCPTCGRRLDPYQTICPVCSVAETKQIKTIKIPSDQTQEIGAEEEAHFPPELLEKKPVTEEMLSKTFVLMETPMLVVRKGKNLGQTYSLNRAFPVSIGRSRVNEIRLDDITVSGQHCRVIPENGRHVLCDLNSTNGTFLNEKKVNRQTLKEGDTIRVGETQFLYKVEQSRT